MLALLPSPTPAAPGGRASGIRNTRHFGRKVKIKSLYCACNERDDNPLDHHAQVDCGAAPVGSSERLPLELINAILRQAERDTYHAAGRITATRGLGCPREVLILDYIPISYDVRRGLTTWHGTIKHKAMHEAGLPGHYQEIVIPPFPFGDFTLEGATDKVKGDFSQITDWKFHSESSQGAKISRLGKGEVDWEGAAQLNIYRIGIAKTVLKVDPDIYRPRLVLVHLAETKAVGVPAFEWAAPIMTEEEILALRPHDHERFAYTQPYTVAQILAYLQEAVTAIKSGVAPDVAIAQVPLVGKAMWAMQWDPKGKRWIKKEWGLKCTTYCAAKVECMRILEAR